MKLSEHLIINRDEPLVVTTHTSNAVAGTVETVEHGLQNFVGEDQVPSLVTIVPHYVDGSTFPLFTYDPATLTSTEIDIYCSEAAADFDLIVG